MSIPHELYDHPIVREVIDAAYHKINSWTISEHPDCHNAKALLASEWNGVCLMEIIAEPMLELRGITPDDMDLFEDIASRYRFQGVNYRTLHEIWDMERAKERP